MQIPSEILVLSFMSSIIKNYITNYKLILKLFTLGFIFFLIYKAISFKEYLTRNIKSEYYEIHTVLENGIFRRTSKESNAKSLRRLLAITIDQMFLWAIHYPNQNMKFTEIVVAKNPTNAVRMTDFLIKISEHQSGIRNIAQELWRIDKRDKAYEILNNPKNSILTIYSSDKFFPTQKENNAQHRLFKENQQKYSNLVALKYETLPLETGCYFIFEVKEFFMNKYFAFYLKGKQDDGEKSIEDEEVEIVFEEFRKINEVHNKNLRQALVFWSKNKSKN